MTTILTLAYGLFCVLVGARGNAPDLLTDLGQEKTFLYWIIVLLVVAALWESEVGEELAKPLVLLIIIGFLLRNWSTLTTNARALSAPAH
jgi:hypothetical protein